MKIFFAFLLSVLIIGCNPQKQQSESTLEFTPGGDNISVEKIMVTALDENIIRVQALPSDTGKNIESLVVIPQAKDKTIFSSKDETEDNIILKTKAITIEISKETGLILFKNNDGKEYLVENNKVISPDTSYKKYHNINISFNKDANEAIYGLGQHEKGVLNYQGTKVTLKQGNTTTAVPFHVSSKGYGILWDNYSITDYNFTGNNYSITSDLGKGIDYYFVAGENTDSIIKGYRKLTGDAPLLPKWGYGYWQSRERYKSQEEILNVARKFRKKEFPVDLIIQDWQYWGDNPWNAFVFDPDIFPDPQKMINTLHDSLNMKFMLVVWARFGKGSDAYNKLKEQGFMYPDIDTSVVNQYGDWAQDGPLRDMVLAPYYDVYNPEARELYWSMIKNRFFDLGVDAWWVDAPEPDLVDMRDYETYLGPGAYYNNTYPLMHAKGIYEGQRKATSKKRVCQLIRSSFAGQQRYGVVPWSGDVVAKWENLKNQIAAAINFNMSGIPYWTSDIGGFFIWDYDNPNTNPEYTDLYTRWFQFATFCPVFRSHGSNAPREPWKFNEKAQDILLKYTNLRYNLIPYIYSNAWQITCNQYTMMRGLMMDFQNDKKVYNIADQYMFGPSLMICPVTKYQATNREVYLPGNMRWYDFYTNQQYNGGTTITADAPIDKIPVYIKAGSIIPMGPEMEYVYQKETDTIDLYVYPGEDAQFTYYMDEGDNYNYEEGQYTTIPIQWIDAEQKITIKDRKGSFEEMKENLVFNVVLIEKEKTYQKGTISYDGKEKTMTIRNK